MDIEALTPRLSVEPGNNSSEFKKLTAGPIWIRVGLRRL